MTGMRLSALLFVMILGLSILPAYAADEPDLSCEELANRRATRQFTEEDAAREDRQAGQAGDSALQRDLLRLEAESYRKKVYEDCLRLRGRPEVGEEPAPSDD